MNTLKRRLTSTKALIATSIIGLIMAMSASSHGQTMDAAPGATIEATESPVEASENPTDIAPTIPETAEEAPVAAPEAPAEAPVSNPAKDDPIGTGKAMVQAFKDGAWLVGFGLALLLAVFITRESLAFFKVKWAKTKPGGFIIAFGLSLATAFGLAFSVGVGFSFPLLVAASGAAWLAAGQHGHIKDVLDWLRKKAASS